MKNLLLATMIGALVTAYTVSPAKATIVEYNFVYTQTGESNQYGNANPPSITDAFGSLWVDTSTNLATAGWIDVTSGPQASLTPYNLVLGSSGGDQFGFAWDNVVTPSGPFFVDSIGIVFQNPTATAEVNLWSNPVGQFSQPAGSYSLWGAPPEYNPESFSLGTLAVSQVPDGGITVALLGMLLVAFMGAKTMSRKLVAVSSRNSMSFPLC